MENNVIANETSQKLCNILKDKPFLLRIGDISETSGVPQSKIRYWEKRGYINSEKTSPYKSRKYTFTTLIQIQIINSYLKDGFTLKAAAERADHYEEFEILNKIIPHRLFEVNKIDDQININMGPVDNMPDHNFYFKIINGQIRAEICQNNHN